MLQRLLAQSARIAVVTRGSKGSTASNRAVRISTGIRAVDVIDTTGAGDSFIASFLAAHIAHAPLLQCLEAGRDQAARTCTHVGGFQQEPQQL